MTITATEVPPATTATLTPGSDSNDKNTAVIVKIGKCSAPYTKHEKKNRSSCTNVSFKKILLPYLHENNQVTI